jgi:hypothetical protein
MISPLGQRQILQTAAVETVRQAMEGGFQVQREQARRQAFDAKLAEAMLDVSDVAETDVLKLTEQGARVRTGGLPMAPGPLRTSRTRTAGIPRQRVPGRTWTSWPEACRKRATEVFHAARRARTPGRARDTLDRR